MGTSDTDSHLGHYVREVTKVLDDRRVYQCLDCDLQFFGARIEVAKGVAKEEVPTVHPSWPLG